MKKCKITIDKIIFEVVLFNSPTANKIWNSLPISSNIKTDSNSENQNLILEEKKAS